ncbi:MAG: hypothetical protein HYR90_03655 [Candidatus Andersenbacteria bacterium]|nr:hypothetical protein [Candidatus Andersenbacteria bacterium]MBI3250360.1 hypothetical protein [Candidatus Andersenbacteria bacterium]
MGLLSVFKGDTLHFNQNAVPVLNDIFSQLNALEASTEKEILIKMLITANKGIDILFHPDSGIIKNKVKSFNREAFYVLYEIIILFLILSLKNVNFKNADHVKETFITTLDRTDECNALWTEMDEFNKKDERILKPIWKKISSYAQGLKRENELVFVSAFTDLFRKFAGYV